MELNEVKRNEAQSKNLLSICSQYNQGIDQTAPQHFRRSLRSAQNDDPDGL
jgi:hypothetical protein